MKRVRYVMVFAVLFCLSELAASATIARLQARLSDDRNRAFTQSVFHSFWKDQYVLQIYDHEQNKHGSERNERFELYLGSGLPLQDWKSPIGVVSRVQKWSSFDPIYAAGLMLNLNRITALKPSLEAWHARTFFQVFAKSEAQQLGAGELLHYYQINKLLQSSVYLRGYNMLHLRERKYGGNIYQAFADLIYPVHEHWDAYYRWSYVSKSGTQLGSKGHTSAIGIRFNF